MPLRTSTIEEPNLNLTPMIDIVFLLVIFFMVGSQFTDLDRQFKVPLAKVGNAEPLTREKNELTVSMLTDGRVAFRKEIVTLDQLERSLKEEKRKDPSVSVRFSGAGKANYEDAMRVLAVIREAGITTVPLTVRQESKTP